jgi:hypothetical protein
MFQSIDLRLMQLRTSLHSSSEFFFRHPDFQIRTWLFYWLLQANITVSLSFNGTTRTSLVPNGFVIDELIPATGHS